MGNVIKFPCDNGIKYNGIQIYKTTYQLPLTDVGPESSSDIEVIKKMFKELCEYYGYHNIFPKPITEATVCITSLDGYDLPEKDRPIRITTPSYKTYNDVMQSMARSHGWPIVEEENDNE